MRWLVVSPGAAWSTADVDAALRYGLERHGVEVVRYRLTERIARSRRWLYAAWREARREDPSITKPTVGDVFYQAGVGVLERALRNEVHGVLVVSAMFLHPDVVILLRRAGVPVVALFTESPYDLAQELKLAALVDGCWTNERTCVEAFARVNPRSGYAPHGWHPERHKPGPQVGDDSMPAHDVVFVGSGFPERLAWLSAIDWTGIDLGLYGHWTLKKGHPLARYVRGSTIDNLHTAALYRRAKVGLNLYRTADAAESCNPRAYELAACGVAHVSSPRAEVGEIFGEFVPQADTPADAERAIKWLLADDERRAVIRAALPARVAACSWPARVPRLLNDLRSVLRSAAA